MPYGDHVVTAAGFYGESFNDSCGCTLVQKTHGYTIDGFQTTPDWSLRSRMVARHDGRAVLIIRNPYEAMLAFRNYRKAGHIGYTPDSHFVGKGGTFLLPYAEA